MNRITSKIKEKAGRANKKIRGWASKTQTDVQSRLDRVTDEIAETGKLLEEKGQLLKEKQQLLKEKSLVLQQIVKGVLNRVEEIRKSDWLPDAVKLAQKLVVDIGRKKPMSSKFAKKSKPAKKSTTTKKAASPKKSKVKVAAKKKSSGRQKGK